MKRAVSVLLVFVLVFSGTLTGCKKGPLAKKPTSPFTLEYDLSEENVDFFVANDVAETAITGGPFYAGAQALPSQKTTEFDTARAKKVDDIKAQAKAIVDATTEAKPAMAALRAALADYLDVVYKNDPTFKDATIEALGKMEMVGAREAIAEADYAALTSEEPTQTYTKAMGEYLAVSRAVELGGLYLQDADQIAGLAAVYVDAGTGSSNAAIKTAAGELDAAMEGLLGDALKALEPVAAHIEGVNTGLAQLASADYYFALEGMGWMDSEMTKLEPVVSGLEARDGLSAEDVQAVKDSYAAFAEWNAALDEQLAAVETSGLVEVAEAPFPDLGVDAAYAAEGYEPGNNYDAAGQVLAMSTEPKAPEKGWLAAGWSGVKSAFGKAKTVVGVGVDAVNAGVYNIGRVTTGIYYGNSAKDVIKDVMDNTKQLITNYNNGVSGASTFKTAGEYLEGTEEGAGKAAGAATSWTFEKIFGKGKISGTAGWAVGGLTKITTGMFTGLAKGIYKVANKESSSADVATGLVEIALGALGGSKVIIKGSQIPGLLKGAKEGIGAFSKTVTTLVGSAANATERGQISKTLADLLIKKGLTKAEASQLISNSIKLEINTAVGQYIAASRATMIKKIRDLIAEGGSAFVANADDTLRSSLKDLLVKGFPKTMQGILDAGTTVIGTNAKEYFDNLVAAGLTDGMLTDLVTTALAVPPDPGQVNGTWNGSITITKVDIPQSEQKTADEAGCEQMFKQLEGKAQAATFTFKLNDAGSGTVTLAGQGGTGTGTATYKDGAIKMVVTVQGTTYTMNGTIAFVKTGGMSMSGSWTAPFQASKIKMSGTFTATK